jgi:hypothetical protein
MTIRVNLSPSEWNDTVSEFGKPNPPAPQPSQGKGELDFSPLRRGTGAGVIPLVPVEVQS